MDNKKQFDKIENLKWYPWVGDNYNNLDLEKRIFILGESSRYGIGDENNTIEKYDNKEYINNHIEDAISGAYKKYGSKLLANMHKTILDSDDVDTEIFWNNVVSTNFIQRPMDYTFKERPNGKDYSDAWQVLFALFKLFTPKYCVFFGSSAVHTIKINIKSFGFKMEEISWDVKVGRYIGYSVKVYDDKNTIDLVFIKHPSSYYSWRPWREYLIDRVPVIKGLVN